MAIGFMSELIHQTLTRYWGYSHFRPLQEEIIRSVLEGRDTLALLPTGGGKSICFQVPALVQDGLCLVVSPLIALMKDQVERLKSKGIPAAALVSGMSRSEIDLTLDNCIYGKTKFLYVSPERLESELFLARSAKFKLNLLAIDEAHCISQWGYDFRPAYLKIAEFRKLHPKTPVLALTATATPKVQEDIQERLGFREKNLLSKSFERPNLSYVVLDEEDKNSRLLKVVRGVRGAGVVYARTRKRTREIAEFLIRNGIKAGYYHAGMERSIRDKVQDDWMKGRTPIIVSTNAFGMGIDKPDVRFVVHMDLPDSLEAYFQEAGRAGRDEKKAYAVLLYHASDAAELERRVEQSFPEMKTIRQVYLALANHFQLPVGSGKGVSFPFDIVGFSRAYDLEVPVVHSCLTILALQGLLSVEESPDFRSRLHIQVRPDALYEFQVKSKEHDILIKTILRSYEGVFEDYVPVSEQELAERSVLSVAQVRNYLQQLVRLRLLDYQPAIDCPHLQFNKERLDIKDLYIDREHLSVRKDRYLERAKAMLQYALDKEHCRSTLLLSYFGETSGHRCGVCDYCLERNKADVNDLEFERISRQVEDQLRVRPMALQELVDAIRDAREEQRLRVITWMLEHEQLHYTDGELLAWRN
jgi:ATP-dependent DNA helicase RecQ